MTETITSDQIVGAAQALAQDEFTRGDVAEKLGVDKAELRKGFVAARRSGRLEKVRDDDENTGHFRLTPHVPAEAPAEVAEPAVPAEPVAPVA